MVPANQLCCAEPGQWGPYLHSIYILARRRGHQCSAPIKVGFSSDCERRIKAIQTSCPFPLDMPWGADLPSYELARAVERHFHHAHKAKRLHGEWFDYEPRAAIAHLCASIRCVVRHPVQDWFAILEDTCVADAERSLRASPTYAGATLHG